MRIRLILVFVVLAAGVLQAQSADTTTFPPVPSSRPVVRVPLDPPTPASATGGKSPSRDTTRLPRRVWTVWLDSFDSAGNQPPGLNVPTVNPDTRSAIAVFTSRDTTIATVSPVGMRVATVAALKSGTTWIVASREALRDSLQLVVR